MTHLLPWPLDEPSDAGHGETKTARFDAPPSNCLLDLHGSLHEPDLVLFMAGNQFRALPELLAAFRSTPGARAAQVKRVFYATTPPGRLLDAMDSGRLATGNFVIDVHPRALWPDAFMAGPREHQRLRLAGRIDDVARYARNRGTALLVRAGNPLDLRTVNDLARPEVRVAISSRDREPASFASYASTLDAQGGAGFADRLLAKPNTVSPRVVHHREIPQLLADGIADAAPLYAHLADYLVTHMPATFDRLTLPSEGNFRDTLSVALLLDSPRPEAAQAWQTFLLGPQAGAVLERHGFDAGAED